MRNLIRSAYISFAVLCVALTGCVHPGSRHPSNADVQAAAEEDLLAMALETVGSLRQEVNALLPARAHMAEEITRLQATVDEQHKLIVNLNDQRGDLIERFARLELQNQSLNDQLERANEDFTRKLAELSEYQVSGQAGGDPARTFDSLREQNAWLKRKLEELRYRIVREQSDVETLRDDLAKIAEGPGGDGGSAIGMETAEADGEAGAGLRASETVASAPRTAPSSEQSSLLITLVISLSAIVCFALWTRANRQRPIVNIPPPPQATVPESLGTVAATAQAPVTQIPVAQVPVAHVPVTQLSATQPEPAPQWGSSQEPEPVPAPAPVPVSEPAVVEALSETVAESEDTIDSEVTTVTPGDQTSKLSKDPSTPKEDEQLGPRPLALKELTPNLTQPIDIDLSAKDEACYDTEEMPAATPAAQSFYDTEEMPAVGSRASADPFDAQTEDLGPPIGFRDEAGMETEPVGPATECISDAANLLEAESDADTQLIRSNPNVKSSSIGKESSGSDASQERDENQKLAEELKGIIHQMLEESV